MSYIDNQQTCILRIKTDKQKMKLGRKQMLTRLDVLERISEAARDWAKLYNEKPHSGSLI